MAEWLAFLLRNREGYGFKSGIGAVRVLTEDFRGFSRTCASDYRTFFLIRYSLTTEDTAKRLLYIRHEQPAVTLTISAVFQMTVYMVSIILILNNYLWAG